MPDNGDLDQRARAAAAAAAQRKLARPRPVILQEEQEEEWTARIQELIYEWADQLGTTAEIGEIDFSVREAGYDDYEWNCPHANAKFTCESRSFIAYLSYRKCQGHERAPANFRVFMILPPKYESPATTLEQYGASLNAYDEAVAALPGKQRRRWRRKH